MTEEKKKPKPVPVRIIKTKGDSALVEHEGTRVYVPVSSVKDGGVSPITLKRGVPYGLPFEELDPGLAEALHAIGIWTAKDLSARQRDAWEMGKGFGIDLGALNRFAHKGG